MSLMGLNFLPTLTFLTFTGAKGVRSPFLFFATCRGRIAYMASAGNYKPSKKSRHRDSSSLKRVYGHEKRDGFTPSPHFSNANILHFSAKSKLC